MKTETKTTDHAAVCPSCGHCPTCGHTPYRYPYRYPYSFPTPFWYTTTASSTSFPANTAGSFNITC